MRLKTTKVEEGRDPSQVVVLISARDGTHYLVLNKHSLDSKNTIDVGRPVGRRPEDNSLLVELPDETDDGLWRVWVGRNDIVEQALEAAE